MNINSRSNKQLKDAFKKFDGNFSAMGRELGISRERVRQLMFNRFEKTGTPLALTEKEIKRRKNAFIKNEFIMDKTAKFLNLSLSTISRFVNKYCPELRIKKRGHPIHTIENKDILKAIKKAKGNIAEAGRNLGINKDILYHLVRYRKLRTFIDEIKGEQKC